MASKYIPFFSLQLLHNYFADNQCSVVQVKPDDDTRELMDNLNIIWKQVDNMVYFYILSDPLYSLYPLVYPSNTDVFRFSLNVTDNTFFNYTNLSGWGRSNNDLYYFSNNGAANLFGSPAENYISRPISSSITGPYNKGTLYNSGGYIYEAAQYPSVGAVPASGNSYSFEASGGPGYPAPGQSESDYLWYNRGRGQSFVSAQDVIQVAGFSYNFPLPGNTPNYTNAALYAYNVTTNHYDILMPGYPVYQNYGSLTPSSCNISLQGLASGLYQVNVNGNTQNLFVDNGGQLSGGLGIIEIYPTPDFTNTGADTYRLFYNNTLYNEPTVNSNYGALLNPLYTIQFANNLVYWQYIPAQIPVGSSANLNSISFGNIPFFNFSDTGTGYTTSNSMRWGSSLLMIPLVEAVPSNTSPYELVYPQATGPPATSNFNLPLAQVTQFQLLQNNPGSGSGSGVSGLVSQLLVSQNYLNVF